MQQVVSESVLPVLGRRAPDRIMPELQAVLRQYASKDLQVNNRARPKPRRGPTFDQLLADLNGKPVSMTNVFTG